MPKDTDFPSMATTPTERPASAATRLAGSSGRSLAPSNRYRVSSEPRNSLGSSSTEATSSGAVHSSEARLSTSNVSSVLLSMSKNSKARLALSSAGNTGVDGLGVAVGRPKLTRYAVAAEATISFKEARGSTGAERREGESGNPKLPQKLRQHVTRLRTQFPTTSNPSWNLIARNHSPSPSTSLQRGQRLGADSVASSSKRFSILSAVTQYSRQSRKLQQLSTDGNGLTSKPPGEDSPTRQETGPAVDAGSFQELLRPLQNSLSCTSLSSEWSSDEDDEAEQLIRQSERRSSHMLRVCCSLDNLLLSIGDQAQEQKHGEAVARGAARELVKLFQFAIKQVTSLVFGGSEDERSNTGGDRHPTRCRLDGKEAQYAMEFLLEVTERFGRVDAFVRAAFVSELDRLRQQVKDLEEKRAAAVVANEQLQNEMRDLRDFHAQSSDFDSTGQSRELQGNSGDDSISATPSFPQSSEDSAAVTDSESEALKQQCQELSRLLEMTRQEIRLSHHERDVHKARLAEMSNALFRDNELSLLRNQIQSEKKRVRILERENLTLRESQHDQAIKLHALQTVNSSESAVATNSGSAPSLRRPSIVPPSSVETAPHTLPTLSTQQQENASVSGGTVNAQSTERSHRLAVEIPDNQFNFTSGDQALQLGSKSQLTAPKNEPSVVEAPEIAKVNWFSRIVEPPEPVRRPRRKQDASNHDEQPSTAELSAFLADLLMTEKQFSAAQEEAKMRRQGNAPALAPPKGALVAKRASGDSTMAKAGVEKRRPRSAASTSGSGGSIADSSSTATPEQHEEIAACCFQLVWAFYQRFLLAVEAQTLLGTRGLGGDPALGGGASCNISSQGTEPVSLALVVFHFFLERQTREADAARELAQFVRCLHAVRSVSYELELFCQFLEGNRSREELCFFLWVCQAMDDITLGVSYDAPLPTSDSNVDSHASGHSLRNEANPRFLCVLKAIFLARTVFRLLHFKVLSQPTSTTSGNRRGRTKPSSLKRRSGSTAALMTAPTSPSSLSPKRKPKTPLTPVGTVLTASIANGESPPADKLPMAAHLAAQAALYDAIEKNQDRPITLESFNNLLLQFAVASSPEELTARLGPLYQPTGDERKLPMDVFLALLIEIYRFQTQWRHDQLRALFMHLNKQEEAQNLAAEKLAKAQAKATNGTSGRGNEAAGQQPSKSKLKKRKKRDNSAENGVAGGSKYLRGLSRGVLWGLLVQSGIMSDNDLAQVDLDWLFAGLLSGAGGSAADITFNGLYDALRKLRWLDSRELCVGALAIATDLSATARSDGDGGDCLRLPLLSRSSSSGQEVLVRAVRENWRVHARHSLALCINDPNVFVRRHSQRLLHYVDRQFAYPAASDASNGGDLSGFALHGIREFLAFAWRVAAKRMDRDKPMDAKTTCLTEIFLVNQALRTAIDGVSGYHWQVPDAEESPQIEDAATHRSLQSFYDTSRMHLKHIVGDPASERSVATGDSSPTLLQEVQRVLTHYAVHLAHLFHRFSEARFNCSAQVAFHRWRAMVYELQLVHPRHLPFSRLHILFLGVALPSPSQSGNSSDCEASASKGSAPIDQDLGVDKTQFSELFVLIALERHRITAARKLKKHKRASAAKPQTTNAEQDEESLMLAARPAQVLAAFCREVLAPRAFGGDGRDSTLAERDFTAKMSCPLVGRALLEHRAFLRCVFFYYAKQDEVAADERAALERQERLQEFWQQTERPTDYGREAQGAVDDSAGMSLAATTSEFHLEKTKRNSMSFGEFQTFLSEFGLLKDAASIAAIGTDWGPSVGLKDAQHVFQSVMALDNDDVSQLEFSEFTAAIMALAVHLNPSPFPLWHQKLDEFVRRLGRTSGLKNEPSVVEAPEIAKVNWFSRIVEPPEPVRRPRRKQDASNHDEQPSTAELSAFLADLLMTEKQFSAAQEEAKMRRQGNAPALAPPKGALVAKRASGDSTMAKAGVEKRRPRSAASTSGSGGSIADSSSTATPEQHEEIAACCFQLVWAFYQRFLLAVEAQTLLGTRGLGGDPALGGGASCNISSQGTEPVSLALVVFHFFLERQTREADAARELAQFVRCLHAVRSVSYELELFCQFLEGNRSREELCFFLWVCQAMDDITLGVSYDAPLPTSDSNVDSHASGHSLRNEANPRFLCVLKAIFLARTVFRLLHFKVLSQPTSTTSGNRRGRTKPSSLKRRSGSTAALMTAPTSPSSLSPKRKPKTPLTPVGTVLTASIANGESPPADKLPMAAHLAAQAALYDAIEKNQDRPITLESFNNLLLQFAVASSPEELTARLGPLYQPTGDERKLPMDVFLALLIEIYRFQTQWRHDQLRALFMHLNKQEEAQNLAAEKLAKAQAKATNGTSGRGNEAAGQQPSKSKLKKRKKRDNSAENGVAGGSKYLRGLSRGVLWGLLVQSGIMSDNDLAQVDLDWLFAGLLSGAGGSAADITFNGLYDALRKLRWLDSRELCVGALAIATDLSATARSDGDGGDCLRLPLLSRSSSSGQEVLVRAVRENWRVHARHSLALCINDPNVFVRRHSQRLLHYVDRQFAYPAASDASNGGDLSGFALHGIREFLAFAWRVAAKRMDRDKPMDAKTTCLTEIFLVNQALRTAIDGVSGYHWQVPDAEESPQIEDAATHRSLQSFYDTSRMHLKHIVGDPASERSVATGDSSPTLLQEVQRVLTHYAVHLAHLFHRFSEARFNCSAQVAFHRWRAMVYELQLVHPRHLPFSRLHILFLGVALPSPSQSGNSSDCEASASKGSAPIDQDLGVDKTQFSELFVLIALERHRITAARKLKKHKRASAAKPQTTNAEQDEESLMLAARPAQVLAAFCREVLAPRAFGGDGRDSTLAERDFTAKMSCPLVGRALLEHRAFLRCVFFYYAKQDEGAADERAALERQERRQEFWQQTERPTDYGREAQGAVDDSAGMSLAATTSEFHLEKTKRNSMSFGEFQTFLSEFGLLKDAASIAAIGTDWGPSVGLKDAQHVFQSVMALDNDDVSQLEFSEFTAAIMALAVHLNPSPFPLWHQKLDEFVRRLGRTWGEGRLHEG
ncbi:hypothetical protein BBJ28_00012662 [Nothophytophthora sp. Chile5]|nr:hypothetical protein BBJ28_00012662 [Nothophytophthora sp. Chile5]